MRQIISVLTAVMILLLGCSQKTGKPNQEGLLTIPFADLDDTPFDDFFDVENARVVQLQYNDTVILSDNLQVKVDGENIFVYDALTVQLYRFDTRGMLLNKVGAVGMAPGEYTGVLSFCCDTARRAVDLLVDAGARMKTFDYRGRLIRSFKTAVNASSFAKNNDNSYWFYTGFSHPSGYRLHLCDTVSIIKSFLSLKTKAIDFSEQNFSGGMGKGLFRESILPSIYLFDTCEVKEVIRFDFGAKTVTEKDFSGASDPYSFYNNLINNGLYSTIQAVQGKRSTCVRILYQDKGSAEIADIIISAPDGTARKITYKKHLNALSLRLKLVHIDENDRYYYSVPANTLEEYIKGSGRMRKYLPEIDPNGNPLLIIVNPLVE
jgi:hypothetical protein